MENLSMTFTFTQGTNQRTPQLTEGTTNGLTPTEQTQLNPPQLN